MCTNTAYQYSPTCVPIQPTCVPIQPTCVPIQPTCVSIQPTNTALHVYQYSLPIQPYICTNQAYQYSLIYHKEECLIFGILGIQAATKRTCNERQLDNAEIAEYSAPCRSTLVLGGECNRTSVSALLAQLALCKPSFLCLCLR